jgi:hypothetical protein
MQLTLPQGLVKLCPNSVTTHQAEQTIEHHPFFPHQVRIPRFRDVDPTMASWMPLIFYPESMSE